jgi:hypothetical protein
MSIVYHYTSQEAAYNIIDTESFRFTNIHFLNDGAEWLGFFDFAKRLHQEAPIPWVAEELARRDKNVEHLGSLGYEDAQGETANMVSVFVACLSSVRDAGSQWVQYANDGQGICLGFDAERLRSWITQSKDFCDPPNGFADWINYDQKKTESLIRQSLKYPEQEAALQKNGSYESEREFRLGYFGVGYWDYTFMPQQNNLKCFVTSRIPDFWHALKEVWVGPGARSEAYFAWDTFLSKKCGGMYQHLLALKKSQSKFRGK